MTAPTATLETPSLTNRLLDKRIVTLSGEVNDELACRVTAELLLLAAEDPERDITLYVSSPGGSVTAGLAIYDVAQHIPNDVRTVALGLAASMGQFLLTAGAPGKRYALPNARIMMHQPHGGFGGTASDIKIQAEQIAAVKSRLAQLTAEHSGRSVEEITRDAERDRWFTAEEAVAYGLIDEVLLPSRGGAL